MFSLACTCIVGEASDSNVARQPSNELHVSETQADLSGNISKEGLHM